MKVLLLAALVASISGLWFDTPEKDQWKENPVHTKYQSGKEYVYKYESQVLTSLPTFTKSHGGVKIIGTVKLAFISSTNGIMQLSDCEVRYLNHEISNPAHLPPTKQIPNDQFSPLPTSEAVLIRAKLQLPMKFRLENGKITSIEITDQETNWSIDLKRSILSMLQVRLQADGVSSNPELPYNKLEQENSTAFDFLEPALDGTCYSSISVQPSVNPAEENQYTILKSRDPRNCVKRNSLYKVTWPQTVTQCDCEPNLDKKECECLPTSEEYRHANPAYFDAKTLSEYEIVSEDQKDLLIKSCVQSATYRYEFPNSPDQYLATFSNQTLQLQQQKEEQSIHIGSHTFKSVSEPWSHQILKDDEEQLMMTPEQIISQAKTLINEMSVLSTQPGRFEDHLTVFYQLVENLRLCKKSQLEELFREHDVRESYKKWKVMVDALAHCNKTVCDEFLLEKIASGASYFPPTESTTVFMLWASNKVPTVPVLDKFSRTVIPALEGKPEQKMAYHHSLLCFGSMVRRYIHSEEIKKNLCVLQSDKLMHQRHINNCRKYEKVIEGKLTDSHTDENKIAVLKALTNLGSLESLPQLQHLMDKTETNAVRVHAIYAVKNLCFQNRLQVLQTLSPLLMDVNEDSEVRMAAFIFYMLCDPSTTQLHRLIEQEPDLDLKTFFVQTLRNELRAMGVGHLKRIQKAKLVLSKIPAFQMSADTGSFEMKYGLRPETDGDILNWRWFTNQTSPFPRSGTFQHRNILRGTPQHSFEMGYRAEGFEALFAKMQEKASSPLSSHPDSSILDSLTSKSRSWKNQQFKPSMTLYIRSEGQHVAFIHLDTETISKHMLEAARVGQTEIPVRLFQTYVTKPEQNKKLQPHGMWQVSERVSVGVIDVDGTLVVRRPAEGELMPNISFGSEKMFRHEKKTLLSQYVRCGFAKTGVTSAVLSRQYISEQMWNVSYSISHQNMTFNVSKPTQEILMVDLEAYTNTFVLPMRVPIVVKEKSPAFKDIVTTDSNRVTFNKQLDAFESVELKARVEGDICVPELYTFVRDRLHLMPSVLSIKKQHIKLVIQPALTSWRNYTFTQSLRTVDNEVASRLSEWPAFPKHTSVESEDKKWGLGSLFDVFSSKDSSEEKISSFYRTSNSKQYDPLKHLRLGSIRQLWQGRISSISERRTLNMVANLTTQFEHEQPAIHHALSCERPPIPSKERDQVTVSAVATQVFNPSINQMVSKITVAWGEKSDPTKSTIDVSEEHTAMYKDNVCYEQTAYGCKDQYGVFYPVWYNRTAVYKSKNNDLIAQYIRAVTPSYMNIAQQVLVQPASKSSIESNKINITRIYRPDSDLVDVAYTLDGQHWNMSRVYMPVEKSFDEYFNMRPMYPLAHIRPVARFFPGHERVNPFFSRDSCVVDNTKTMSMDYKLSLMPKSDCEVVLVGDCARQTKQLMVSLKTQVSQNSVSAKLLKVIVGGSKIEIELSSASSFRSSAVKITVNGQLKNLDTKKQLLVKQDEQTVAIVECSSDKRQCDVKSSPLGLYVSISMQRVKVEMEKGRSRYLCGLCSSHPEIQQDRADYTQSVQIFKNNRRQGEQCNIEEKSDDARRFAQQQSCDMQYKHKITHALSNGELKTCVTTDKLTLCSRHCEEKQVRFDVQPARCVSRKEAQKLDLTPTMEGNEMYLQDERILSRMQSSEVKHLKVPISQNCL